MMELIKRLYPICRSITGDGVRETLRVIKEYIPIEIHEVSTGTQVFDWTVPKEWNVKDAYVKNSKGDRVIDFQKSNLHVLNYSIPVNTKMRLEELKPHLRTLPEHPDWIPYATSYYKEQWGFCLSHNDFLKFEDDEYEVVIDSTLESGSLTYGELFLKGESEDEVLLTSYVCHPSMCNDNLSGVALLTFLAKELMNAPHRYSYRLLFIPETIGAITWLAQNPEKIERVKHGLVATCVGDLGASITYKRSREGNRTIDHVVERVLKDSGKPYEMVEFNPADGSDERQFCSPAFDLSVGSLMRTPYVRFPGYHTSADTPDRMSAKTLAEMLELYLAVCRALDKEIFYMSTMQTCEPQLGRRGLYRQIGAPQDGASIHEGAIFWVINFSDGKHSLQDIALRSGIPLEDLKTAADTCRSQGLLKEAGQ